MKNTIQETICNKKFISVIAYLKKKNHENLFTEEQQYCP